MAVAVLLACRPLASKRGSVRAEEDALSFHPTSAPFALVNFAGGADAAALALRLVVLPIALVNGAVEVDLPAAAIAASVLPLAVVKLAGMQLEGLALLEGEGSCKLEGAEARIQPAHRFRAAFWQLLRFWLQRD